MKYVLSIFSLAFHSLFLQFSFGQQLSLSAPNVVIIFADDMGYGDVSALNPEAKTITPNIDRLVAQGITFRDAHSSASVCTPSRYGLLTGRYAWRSEESGVINGFGGPVIDRDRLTLGNVFQNAGYTTACVGKWHLGLEWKTRDGRNPAPKNGSGWSNVDYSLPVLRGPNDYGFDYTYILPASLDMPPYLFLENHLAVDSHMVLTSDIYKEEMENTEYAWDKKHTRPGDVYWRKGVWWRKGEMSESFRIEDCLPEIVNRGAAFMTRHKINQEAVSKDKTDPFFLYLPLSGPHTPWMPTSEFQGKTSIGDYGDFVLQIDHVVGEVVNTLKQIGEWENTILIFASDNGAYWPEAEIALQHHDSNAGRRGQKGDIWDGGHRIPLVISWPDKIQNPGLRQIGLLLKKC